jgi:hypothetical protein
MRISAVASSSNGSRGRAKENQAASARWWCTRAEPARCSFTASQKSDRANIREDELTALKALAVEMLGYDAKALAKAVASGTLIEVQCDEREEDAEEQTVS